MAALDGVCTDEPDLVHVSAVEAVACEAYYLPARVEWQAGCNGGASLVMRRLFVCARLASARRGAGGPMRQVRQGRHGSSIMVYHHCAGTVFGVTLGNLLHHCTNVSLGCHATKLAVDCMRRVLSPVGRALASCTGEDITCIARGLAVHRVAPGLARKLRELKLCRPLEPRIGNVSVVVGITAAILTSFECMTMRASDCDGLDEQLLACLRDTQVGLVCWRLPAMFTDEAVVSARDAEIRALERARIGVERAAEVGGHLRPVQRMRLYLDCFRRAAWPPGEDLGRDGHVDLLKRIRSGELCDMERDACNAPGATAPGIASLAALSALPAASATDTRWSALSESGSSSWPSSLGSHSSTESGGSIRSGTSATETGGGGYHAFGLSRESMQQLADAFSSRV